MWAMQTPTTVLLNTAEVCERLGEEKPLHPSTLSRWVAAGRIAPAMKLPGERGAFLFDPTEVDRVRAELDEAAATATERSAS